MQYSVSYSLTTGGFEIGWNTDLSAGDKAFIAKLYPMQGERPLTRQTARMKARAVTRGVRAPSSARTSDQRNHG